MKKIGFLLIIVFYSFTASSLSPKLKILTDSAMVGQNVEVSLSYSHKTSNDLFFPDSAYNYGDLEYLSHKAFPTKTDSLSLDSAVYIFANFSTLDSTAIKLPIYILSNNDSIILESNSDYFITKKSITQLPDSIHLKTQLDFITISKPTNYNLIILVVACISFTILVLIIMSWKKIKRLISTFILKKRIKKYINQLNTILNSSVYNAKNLNSFSKISKLALEHVTKKKVSTYTSRQINQSFENDFNTSLFSELDRCIYSSNSNTPEGLKTTLSEIIAIIETSLEQKTNSKNG